MGEGICVKCRNCSRNKDFFLGLGWEYSSLETVISSLHPSKREEVQKIYKDHDVLQRESDWRPYHCEKCKRLYGRFWLKLTYAGSQVYETVYHRGKCGGKLDQLRNLDRISQIPCHYCGGEAVTLETEFLWD